jgi:hypothetical protein
MLKRLLITVAMLGLVAAVVGADLPTVISFQGRLLSQPTVPVTGTQDLTFTMYDANDAPIFFAGWPLVKSLAVGADGVFTTTLEVGAGAFTLPYRLGVSFNGNDLLPHQLLTAAPYALTAQNIYGGTGYFASQMAVADRNGAAAHWAAVMGGADRLIHTTAIYADGPTAIHGSLSLTTAQHAIDHSEITTPAIRAIGGNFGLFATGKTNGVSGFADGTRYSAGVKGLGYYGVSGTGEIGVYGHGVGAGVSGVGVVGVKGIGGKFGVYGEGWPGATTGVYGSGNLGGVSGYSPTGDGLFAQISDQDQYPEFCIALKTYGRTKFEALPTASIVADNYFLLCDANGNYLGKSTYTVAQVLYSSLRYKEKISDLPVEGEKVLNLRPVGFTWKNNKKADIGLIAEAVEKEVKPLVIYNEKTGAVEGVRYDRLSLYLLGVLKDQQAAIDELKSHLTALEARRRNGK